MQRCPTSVCAFGGTLRAEPLILPHPNQVPERCSKIDQRLCREIAIFDILPGLKAEDSYGAQAQAA
jgi:hypothetical protein